MRTPHPLCLALLVWLSPFIGTQWVNGQARAASQSEILPAVAPDAVEGMIHLDVVVTDKAGKPVSGLGSGDFTLLDNGQPGKILSFHAYDSISASPNPPVEVVLVIDTLDLPSNLANSERFAVEAFLRQNGGHLAQPASVFLLSEMGLWSVGHPSSDGNALAAELLHNRDLAMVRPVRSGARENVPDVMGLKDAASLVALKALGEITTAERRKPGRKLLLWVGPGWGVGSGEYADSSTSKQQVFGTICWFSTLLRESRTVLYSFSVGETDPRGLLYLDSLHGVQSAKQASFMNLNRKVLAVQSGGRVLETGYDLVRQIQSCVQEASIFYTLSFNPAHADSPDEFHALQVQVANSNLIAHTNNGYYDQPYYSDPPNLLLKRVSVEQLEQMLNASRSEQDTALARQLSGLELTERLSSAKLSLWTAGLHGQKSRQVLVALADASAFLEPPSSEIPADAPPDIPSQQRMMLLAVEYLKQAIPKLPDFYAIRTTVHYQETPQMNEANTKINYQPLRVADNSKETVLYRGGREVVDTGKAKQRRLNMEDPYLITYGTFGPVLDGVRDAIAAGLTWSRWEHGAEGLRAVFRYKVPAEHSRYQVSTCCLPDGDGKTAFWKFVGYHGEIAIDPAAGTILRLEWRADLKSTTLLDRSDITIEYGPVEIGSKVYICPVRSVSLMRTRSLLTLWEWDKNFKTYGPYATVINDIAYGRYHMFGSESTVLTEFTPVP